MENLYQENEMTETEESVEEQIDRKVREAVEQARAEWAEETAQAVADTERVASMSEEERARYNLARREAALQERERALVERELRAMALEKLAQRGLPRELADALDYTDQAKCLAALDKVERAFRTAVQAGVDERLRGETPAGAVGDRVDADAMTDAEFYRMNARKA